MTNYLRPQSVALIALALGVAATVAGWYVVGRQAEAEARAEFATQAALATTVIERRVQRYVDLLYGLDAFVNHEPRPSRDKFHVYVTSLELGQRMPACRRWSSCGRARSEREAYVASVRTDRSVCRRATPTSRSGRRERAPECWVIDYLRPLAGNEAAFGLDIRERRGAMQAAERARHRQPDLHRKYRLAQETGNSYGLVIYLPVYSTSRPRNVAQRREGHLGFVNVVLRMDDLMAGMIAEPVAAGMRIRMHDRGAMNATLPPSEATVFYTTPGAWRSDAELGLAEWRPRDTIDLGVGGRQWLLEFDGPPSASPWLRPLPLLRSARASWCRSCLRGPARGRARRWAISLAQRPPRAAHALVRSS